MVPNVGQFDPNKGSGASFAAAASYIVQPHSNDAIKAGRTSSPSRVGWVWMNPALAATIPDLVFQRRDGAAIGAAMQSVAENAAALKKAAGVRAGGRPPTTRPEYTVSFSPAKDVKLSPGEWHSFLQAGLKALGVPDGHQVFAAVHTDTDHPHLHVLINRVNSKDGTRWNANNDMQKWQSFCDDWCKQRALNPCPERRKRIDATRAWAAAQPAPSRRNRSSPAYERTAQPARVQSWAEKKARRDLTRLIPPGLEGHIPADMEAAAVALAKKHRQQMASLAEIEANEVRQSNAQQKAAAARRDAALAAIKNRKYVAADEIADWWNPAGIGKAITHALYATKVKADREKMRVDHRRIWANHFHHEKTMMGRLGNALHYASMASRLGVDTSFSALRRSPEERRRVLSLYLANERKELAAKHRLRRTPDMVRFAAQNTADRKAVWDSYKAEIAPLPRTFKALKALDSTKQRRAAVYRSQAEEWQSDFVLPVSRLWQTWASEGRGSASSAAGGKSPAQPSKLSAAALDRIAHAENQQRLQRQNRLSGNSRGGPGRGL